MKRFVILSYAEPDIIKEMAKATPEQMEKGKQRWFQWRNKYAEKVVDIGSPLFSPVNLFSDGTTENIESKVNGYMIVEAETFDEALEIIKDSPLLPYCEGCKIEIHEGQKME